jgi:hypothetical protein
MYQFHIWHENFENGRFDYETIWNFNSFVSFILKLTCMTPQYVISIQNALHSVLTIRGLLDLTVNTYSMPQYQFHCLDMTLQSTLSHESVLTWFVWYVALWKEILWQSSNKNARPCSDNSLVIWCISVELFFSSQIPISLLHCQRLWTRWFRIVPLMLGGPCTTILYCLVALQCSGTLDVAYREISKGL